MYVAFNLVTKTSFLPIEKQERDRRLIVSATFPAEIKKGTTVSHQLTPPRSKRPFIKAAPPEYSLFQ